MNTREEIAILFEAQSVALEAITDMLAQARVDALVDRLSAAGDDLAGVQRRAAALATDLPTRRRDADHIIGLARALRDEVQAVLRPAPVGLDRRDIHG